MGTIQQIDDFSRYAKQLSATEGELPLDVIFDRWHEDAHREDDLRRIRASLRD